MDKDKPVIDDVVTFDPPATDRNVAIGVVKKVIHHRNKVNEVVIEIKVGGILIEVVRNEVDVKKLF